MSSEALRPSSSGRKPLGKLAARLEEVKNPWRRQGASSLELSHNEAARLATDALLEHGEREYRRVLAEERELNFLSPLELRYISRHAARAAGPAAGEPGPGDDGDADAVSELTSGTYFPMMSDEEPPLLELGWPENLGRFGPSETQIYFQRDKSHNVKDLIRSLINKAQRVVALVMDVFTDVDLLCDLMEASNKRRVPVYILLDDKNLHYFAEMCSMLDIQNTHLSNMRVRSVCGDTYCTKSGKKFSGQVLEKFMIIDCEEVIAGSYSFTWLSAQVHSNMVMHFTGRIADGFDREFRCLYADSQPISCFSPGEDEGGGACYPSYPPVYLPAYPGAQGAVDLLADSRQRERLSSEYSSSQSSGSVSSVKAAPTMTSGTTFKVTQGHDQNEATVSPERRERAGALRLPTPSAPAANGGTNHSAASEQRPPPAYGHTGAAYGQPAGVEWNRSREGVRGWDMGGAATKFQTLALHDHKGGAKSTGRSSTNQLLNKFTDFFLPQAPPSQGAPPRPPSPWGGPDLTQAEPESQQSPPPPPPLSPSGAPLSRQDQKRMTLGHSKLDLVNQYNHRMKGKQVYSRFELKTNN
ncbi:protein FAM83C isoform X2 [Nelusetta ayraudi]|uniref:protein FAM83C isoform X1 n=1 Tax=Nelusetta ayraudi TaxID=303726 RepID=UPI003F6ED18D